MPDVSKTQTDTRLVKLRAFTTYLSESLAKVTSENEDLERYMEDVQQIVDTLAHLSKKLKQV